jgi:drug/metabolite transporter (DMT)-like permease
MPCLLLASVIWGFSFGILKDLTTELDPFVVNIFRSGLAALFFCPWFFLELARKVQTSGEQSNPNTQYTEAWSGFFSAERKAFICGTIQIGLMYGPYTLSFRHLKAYEVALFTMTTPLVMSSLVLIENFIRKRHVGKKPTLLILSAALLATLGGIITTRNDLTSVHTAFGAGLVTSSNILFAIGMILWTRWFKTSQKNLTNLMTPFFLGAFFTSLILSLLFSQSTHLPQGQQWLQLMWLGGVSSGLGFYIWNLGALKVSPSTLSVANNIKLPIAIVISLVVFGEQADVRSLTIGIILIMMALKLGSFLPKTTQPH